MAILARMSSALSDQRAGGALLSESDRAEHIVRLHGVSLRWLRSPAIAVATVLVMVAGMGVPAMALPAPPADPPAVSPGPAVRGVHAVQPRFGAKADDPAARNFVPKATAWPAA